MPESYSQSKLNWGHLDGEMPGILVYHTVILTLNQILSYRGKIVGRREGMELGLPIGWEMTEIKVYYYNKHPKSLVLDRSGQVWSSFSFAFRIIVLPCMQYLQGGRL